MSHRNTQTLFAAGAICAVMLSDSLLTQAKAAAQPPAQGPPAASQNAQSVPATESPA